MRAMLDQLMGKDRDVPLDQRVIRRPQFSDPEVCKHALAGLCPFGLFPNTKSDLGPCEYEIHEDHLDWEAIQREYDELPAREKDRLGYERALLRLLDRLVAEMDRKIIKAQERARMESAPKPLNAAQQAEVDALRQQAKDLTERSEKLAEEGDVDASMAAVAQAERLRKDAEGLIARYSRPDRQLEVCEVCGLFMQSTDSEARKRDHIEGKQYQGWLAIRQKHSELQQKLGPGGGAYPPLGARGEPEEGEVPGAQHDDKDRSRSRSHGRHREERDRDRERRRSRSRSRDRRRDDRYRDDRRRDDRYRDDRRRDDRDRDYRRSGSASYNASPYDFDRRRY